MMGKRVMRLIREVMGGTASHNEQEVAELVPAERLKLAKRWQRGEVRLEQLNFRQLMRATRDPGRPT